MIKCFECDIHAHILDWKIEWGIMSPFRFSVIPILADILSDSVKEKVTRIILAVFRVSMYEIYSLHLTIKFVIRDCNWSNLDCDDIFLSDKQTLNSHATIHFMVMIHQLAKS
jgi:hypothetical protein